VFRSVVGRTRIGGREPHQLPPGRHGLPRAFVIQNQRERILAAVADVTSASGYSDMTVEDVIVSAGVSRRTFYEHFKNKEDAFLAAYDTVVAQLLVGVREAYSREATFAQRMRTGLDAFLRLLAREPGFASMCVVEVLAAGPEAIKRRNAAMKAFADLIDQNARALLPDPRPSPLTAELIVGGIHDVVYTRIQRGEASRLPELAPELVHGALVAYLGPERAEAAGTGVA
jgi:AcrR family transcriptional regulator